MIPWYVPINVADWRRRLLSPRAIPIVVGIALLAGTEWRFDWVEKAVGAYLVSTNLYRPQSGAVWEQGHKTDSARQALAQYAQQRQNAQREALQASSLGEVISSIVDEKGAMISAQHFLALYLKLPPMLADEVISPYSLLAYLSKGTWQRTLVEKQEEKLQVYLLDAQNQVLHRLRLQPDLVAHIERGEVAVGSSLDQLSDFSSHIYPAERFFSQLNALPDSSRRKIVAHPEELLRMAGRIRRVGLSNADYGETVDLGFEIEGPEGSKVILLQGIREEVRRLQRTLEPGSSSIWPWSVGDDQ